MGGWLTIVVDLSSLGIIWWISISPFRRLVAQDGVWIEKVIWQIRGLCGRELDFGGSHGSVIATLLWSRFELVKKRQFSDGKNCFYGSWVLWKVDLETW